MWYVVLFWTPFLVLVIGIGLILLRRQLSSKRVGIHFTIVGSALSLLLLVFHFTYPTSSELETQQRLLFSTNSASIDTVVISPRNNKNQSLLDLVASTITVRNHNEIDSVIHALRSAERFSPNHPAAQWSCMLTITSHDDAITVEVADTKSEKNGCLVYVWSNRTEGWLIGTYRCDRLSPILERLAKGRQDGHRISVERHDQK